MPLPGNPSALRNPYLALQDESGAVMALVDGRVPVALTDSTGAALSSQPSGSYLFPILVRQTAALAINAVVWTMHNRSSTKTAYVRRIRITQSFDGSITGTAALNTLSYALARFAGTSVDTGNNLGSAIKKRSSYAASDMQGNFDGAVAITGTGIVAETPFAYCSLSLAATLAALGFPLAAMLVACPEVVHDFQYGEDGGTQGAFELAPGEGILIKVTSVATLVGSVISGGAWWDER